jgi:uncharacterized repeat protein (TIGR01451 family)
VSVASSKTPDPVPGNNSGSATATVVTRADLSVTKTGPGQPIAGDSVSYTIGVTNSGPSVARTVSMSDVVPTGTTFSSIAKPTGWTCTTPTVGGTGTVTCSVASLATNASASFTLVVRLPSSATEGAQLCNTSSASTATTDPVSTNNSAQTCGTVRTLADLSIAQTAATSGKPGKGAATFVIRVTNNGPSDAKNLIMTASSSLFTGPAPSMVTTAGGTCSVTGSTVRCSWSSLALAATAQVAITVPWRSAVGDICVSDSVLAATSDPNPINNSGGVCVGKKK